MSVEGDTARYCEDEPELTPEHRESMQMMIQEIWSHFKNFGTFHFDSMLTCDDEELRYLCRDVCDSVEGYKNRSK